MEHGHRNSEFPPKKMVDVSTCFLYMLTGLLANSRWVSRATPQLHNDTPLRRLELANSWGYHGLIAGDWSVQGGSSRSFAHFVVGVYDGVIKCN